LLAPDSRYSAAELGLEPERWRWLCVPGTANPFTGYGALVRTGGLRRDSAVDVSAKSPDPEAADLCDTLPAPYPDRWPRWVPPDRSVTLTCPGCACELTGVEDHRGGVMGYGCLVSPFGEGRYEEEDSEQGSSGGSGGVISVGGSVGGFSGEGPVFVRPSLLHHYWDEVETNEQGNKVDMEEGYLEDSEAGMEEGCVLVTESGYVSDEDASKAAGGQDDCSIIFKIPSGLHSTTSGSSGKQYCFGV